MLQTQSNLNIAQPRNSLKKSGISIISCHILKPIKRTPTMTNQNININTNTNQNIKSIANKTKNQIRRQKNNRQNYKPLRSLSAERIRWKREKNMKKNQLKEDQQRGEMQGNINLLEMQYDQLRLKRSLLTQRQSEKSAGKPRISDAQIKSQPKLASDISNSLITKCVPKSKINLNLFTHQPPPSTQNNQTQQKQLKKQRQIQRERISSTSSVSVSASNMNMKILDSNCHLSQSVCSSSLSNLQVIPIGLNVSIAMNNKTQFSTCQLSKSYFRRKGIKVVSRNRDDGVSLDNSVVSLEVVRQVSKGKLGYKTQQNSVVKLKKSYQNIAASYMN